MDSKLQLKNLYDDEWEFEFPISMRKIADDFDDAVEAMDSDSVNAEKGFKKIIQKYPYHIDAYNHLSLLFSRQKKYFESLLCVEKAYNIGQECFPKNFDFEKGKIIWGGLSNRPFLRSCQFLGLEYQRIKEYDKALNIYEKVLKFNPNDNNGLRYLALECHLLKKDFGNAKILLNQYSDDYSIEFLTAQVILNIEEGNKDLAIEKLKEVKKRNKYIIRVIKKENPLSEEKKPLFNFGGIAMGSLAEADEYYKRNLPIFKLKKVVDFFNKYDNKDSSN